MNNIRELCKKKGLSQKEIALTIGVTQPTVSDWFTQKKNPRGESLDKLEKLLNASKAEILGYAPIQTDESPSTTEDDEPDANRLRECRKIKGLTQKCVADMLGVSSPAISQWEKGETSPSSENLAKLAKIYGVSTDYLMGLDTPETSADIAKLRKDHIRDTLMYGAVRRTLNLPSTTNRLQKLRMERGLTQAEAADLTGIDRVSYTRFERGIRVPPADKLVILADFFGVTTDYLLGRSDIRWPYTHAPDGMVIGIPVEAQKAPASAEAGEKPRTISLGADDVLAGSDEPLRAYIQQLVREELEKATREK